MDGKQLYDHTQKSPLHMFLYLPALLMFFVAWQMRTSMPVSLILLGVGCLLLLSAFAFQTLNIREGQDALQIKFGPLNIFGTQIKYSDMTNVEAGRTKWLDGLGIHYVPFRGWVMNLWGFECVTIERGASVIRVGTDDSENLAAMLKQRLESNNLQA